MSNATLVITTHDDQKLEVTPNIGDTLAFESTLRKNKAWGSLTDNAMRMQFFRAWSAAKRENKTDQTWDEFSSGEHAAVDVSFKKDDDESGDDDAVVSLGESIPEGQPTSY
ncbi:hypothetical protein DEJ16_12635 [Curtobacterium sp. MCJR17_055]|uniref:hypothetical protein n=1 Tax=unclassified Curtobacterium TaxID=257496 RepID=UPI000D9C9275|nr:MULTISPECIES: hypothetical protein [unclassified Curtobacterium]PYY34096.1 hypothetical protein DEI87_10060 [Curtobacterium sp. MCBD17_029]PYY53946.1 hypothetical protein DEJ16_12635 [Curtobacterium sp. MCJR17_055]PYY59167.1 hypothetical protein DEJ26_09180 [Curtobacterium sp. MCPF17_015]